MKEANPSTVRKALLDILALEGVKLMVETEVEEITDRGLMIRNKQGDRQTLNADTVVVATGSHSNTKLFQSLQGKSPEIYLVGDSVTPRNLLAAIDEGFKIALTI